MKKIEKRLPKFESTTLRMEDLKQATGGAPIVIFGVTLGTRSVCHKDGVDDADRALTLRF